MPSSPPHAIAAHHPPTRNDSIAAAHLLEFDPRLTRAAGIPVPVAITPEAWTAAVAPTRPTTDPAEGQAMLGRALDVLQAAHAATAQHPGPEVAFTVYVSRPCEGCEPVTLTARSDRGDCGEPVLTITTAAPPPVRAFRLAGQEGTWPALRYHPAPPAPVVTAAVLHVLIAHALDRGTLAAVRVDADSDTVRVCNRTGRVATLRPADDGSYDLAPMRPLGWAFISAS